MTDTSVGTETEARVNMVFVRAMVHETRGRELEEMTG
jgi:hypothetical protein